MKTNYKLKDYSLVYTAKWKIKGFDHYAILENQQIFNHKTNRFSKRCVHDYSLGLNLDGKFYTINKLKDNKMIYLVKNHSVNLSDPKQLRKLLNNLSN